MYVRYYNNNINHRFDLRCIVVHGILFFFFFFFFLWTSWRGSFFVEKFITYAYTASGTHRVVVELSTSRPKRIHLHPVSNAEKKKQNRTRQNVPIDLLKSIFVDVVDLISCPNDKRRSVVDRNIYLVVIMRCTKKIRTILLIGCCLADFRTTIGLYVRRWLTRCWNWEFELAKKMKN